MSSATAGSLYIAGFAQIGDPHAALLLATSSDEGYIFHITTKPGNWTRVCQKQKIQGSVTLMSLINIRDASKGALTKEGVEEIVSNVNVPAGSTAGECLIWVTNAVKLLAEKGIVTLTSAENLVEEFSTFCAGNRSYATSSKYPNIKASSYCA